jgi:hypothetical protein
MRTIVFLVILAFVIWFVFWLIDSSNRKQLGQGVVVERKSTEEQNQYVDYGNNSGGHIQRAGGSYTLRIRISDRIASKSVSKEVYESIKEGDSVSVEYSQGRLLKEKLYIKKVYIMQEFVI